MSINEAISATQVSSRGHREYSPDEENDRHGAGGKREINKSAKQLMQFFIDHPWEDFTVRELMEQTGLTENQITIGISTVSNRLDMMGEYKGRVGYFPR